MRHEIVRKSQQEKKNASSRGKREIPNAVINADAGRARTPS